MLGINAGVAVKLRGRHEAGDSRRRSERTLGVRALAHRLGRKEVQRRGDLHVEAGESRLLARLRRGRRGGTRKHRADNRAKVQPHDRVRSSDPARRQHGGWDAGPTGGTVSAARVVQGPSAALLRRADRGVVRRIARGHFTPAVRGARRAAASAGGGGDQG